MHKVFIIQVNSCSVSLAFLISLRKNEVSKRCLISALKKSPTSTSILSTSFYRDISMLTNVQKTITSAVETITPMYQRSRANLPQRVLSAYRPNDWTHLYYGVQAYQDDGGQVLNEQGWKLIDEPYFAKDGYFGAAYCNNDNKHIIIAHRGTQDLKDWLTNVDLITRRLNEQEASAWEDFSKKIVEKYGATYTYSFAGHSLGGWLAQTCLWKYQDQFVKNEELAYQDAFAVTLDDPGAKELLEGLQPRLESSYKIEVKGLDITSYLSRPNIVNTAMGHAGSVYALFPDVSDLSWLQRNTLGYTLKTHDKEFLLKQFTPETGLPAKCMRVIDWPKVMWGAPLPSANKGKGVFGYLTQMVKSYVNGDIQRGEYTGFYTYDSVAVNDPQQLTSVAQFQLQHGIHYRVQAFDEQVLPLRNMPTDMRRFLEKLGKEKDRVKVVEQLLSNPMESELATLLNVYRINDREELVLDKSTLADVRLFRDKMLRFLSDHSQLWQVKLSVLRMESLLKQVQDIQEAQANNMVASLLSELSQQSARTRDLIRGLSFKQGAANLYKFIKPTWQEIKQAQEERDAIEDQLKILERLKLRLQTTSLKDEVQVMDGVHLEAQQLKVAEQSATALLMYLEEDPLQDSQLDKLIATLKDEKLDLGRDRALLLNRAYNLKAKIAARLGNREKSGEYYRQATELLRNDAITWSNYGGLLADRGYAEKNGAFYVEAYRCFQRVYERLDQIKDAQLPVVCSGMAYGFLLLVQSLEQKQLDQKANKLPNVEELRNQARNLLERAIKINPSYLNARVFLAILAEDEQDYALALQEVNNALSMQPAHPIALKRKGFVLDKLGQSDEAIEALEQAMQTLKIIQKQGENEDWIQSINEKVTEMKESRRKLSK